MRVFAVILKIYEIPKGFGLQDAVAFTYGLSGKIK